MNELRLSPDDPKLTAYALGELAGDERAAVEAALRQNPALRAMVEEIRGAAAQFEAALAAETAGAQPVPPVRTNERGSVNGGAAATPAISPPRRVRRRMVVVGEGEDGAAEKDAYAHSGRHGSLLGFPHFYYVAGMLAAACFAVLVAFYERPIPADARVGERRAVETIALKPAAAEPADSVGVATAVAPAETSEQVASAAPVMREVAAPETGSQSAPGASVAATVGGAESATAPTAAAVPIAAPNTMAFIAGDLSLVAQTKGAGVNPGERSVASVNDASAMSSSLLPQNAALVASGTQSAADRAIAPIDAGTGGGRDERANETAVASSDPVAVGSSIAGVPQQPAGEPIRFQAPPQAVSERALGGALVAGLTPGTAAFGGTTSITAAPGSGETVMLSAFMVASDRGRGFAVASSEQDNISGARELSTREILPSPPPGATFGRNAEAHSPVRDNEFVRVRQERRSTFSIDVDTASYANVRRIIEHGSLPARDAVRIEELLNYFPYRYPAPKEDALAATLEVAEAPWAPKHKLVRIGLKARDVPLAQRAPANLVFLLDVSSSMNQLNKLPLVKQSLRLLIGRLRPEDRIAIVTYAGTSGLALASTPVAQSREILNALDALAPGGPASGTMGIRLAYEIAQSNFVSGGVNRVVLCTDGDFDVGITREDELVRFIEGKAETGVFLTVLGFGMGNYQDATLEKLASRGNGNYGYIDTRREAEKLLVEQIDGTLVTVAKDVKVEVEFNPAKVARYRLIGYENRRLRKEDFNTDQVDAGEIGAGQTVTALYEIVPVSVEPNVPGDEETMDASRYATSGVASSRLEMPDGSRDTLSNELLTVRVRYKKPDSFFSFGRTLELPLVDASTPFGRASADFRFAAAVAQFGMLLRGSSHRGTATIGDIAAWAATAVASPGDDPGGFRAEFIELVRKTRVLME